jgi:hypothetical protein
MRVVQVASQSGAGNPKMRGAGIEAIIKASTNRIVCGKKFL